MPDNGKKKCGLQGAWSSVPFHPLGTDCRTQPCGSRGAGQAGRGSAAFTRPSLSQCARFQRHGSTSGQRPLERGVACSLRIVARHGARVCDPRLAETGRAGLAPSATAVWRGLPRCVHVSGRWIGGRGEGGEPVAKGGLPSGSVVQRGVSGLPSRTPRPYPALRACVARSGTGSKPGPACPRSRRR